MKPFFTLDLVLNTEENYFLTKMLGDHICFFIALAYIDRATIGNLSAKCYSSALVEGTLRWIQRIVFFDEEVLFFGDRWLTFLPEFNVLYLVRQFGEQITVWTASSSATLWGNLFNIYAFRSMFQAEHSCTSGHGTTVDIAKDF